MALPSTAHLPFFGSDIYGLGGAGADRSLVNSQWRAVVVFSTISRADLKQFPELVHHIEVTLGYGSIDAFLLAHSRTALSEEDGVIRLSDDSIDAIDASISGSVDGGEQHAESARNQLTTTVDPDSTFVAFTLNSGEKITFDGPGAGTTANQFAVIYNNSRTFRHTMQTLAGRQGGQYSFHNLPTGKADGFNISGTDSPLESSGVFIQSHPLDEAYLPVVIIHEAAHDLQGEDSHEGGLDDAGDSHSREQSLFHGKIVNELKENGVDIGFDVDGDDYSHDTRVLDETHRSSDDRVTTDDVVTNEYGQEINAMEYYSSQYAQAKGLIAQGRYQEAKVILDKIPPNAQITFKFENPQTGLVRKATYNVRELFLQDLMLSADSADRFDTDTDDPKAKQDLTNFLNVLVADETWVDTIESAAEYIYFNLATELPDYKYAFALDLSDSSKNNSGTSRADIESALGGLPSTQGVFG